MAALDTLRRIAPEFATLGDTVAQGFLDDALDEINMDVWDDKVERAQALLAAHQMSVAHPELATPAGPVLGECVGGVSATYAVGKSVADEQGYELSRHGREYLRLLRQLGLGLAVA